MFQKFARDDENNFVPVDFSAVFIDSDKSVGVAVVRKSDVGVKFLHHLPQKFCVGRAALVIDNSPATFVVKGIHGGVKAFKNVFRNV